MENHKPLNKLYLITITLVLSLMILLVALFVNRLDNHRTYIIETQISRMETMNRLASSAITNYFGKINLALEAADFCLSVHPDSDPRFNEDFVNLISLLEKDMMGKVSIHLVSKTGGLFYIPSKSTTPLSEVSDREYFKIQQNPKKKGFYIADPIKSRINKKWGIPISYPLSSNQYDMSVIFALLELSALERVLDDFTMPQDGTMLLVRGDGMVISTVPFDEKLIGKSLVNYAIWQQIKDENTLASVKTTNAFEGGTRYYVSHKIKDFPVYVVSTCVQSQVVSPWWSITQISLLIGVLILMVLGTLSGVLISLIKQLNNAFIQITMLSHTDALTGLYNRRYFNLQVEDEMKLAYDHHSEFSIALMDIDHFKVVNDTYGHDIGDTVLRYFSELLIRHKRPNDIQARWGGEEFILLLRDTTLQEAVQLMESLRVEIERQTFPEVGQVTCSFGVAVYQSDATQEILIDRADKMLYLSKHNGRNQVNG